MKAKNLITALLLGFVGLSVAYMIVKEQKAEEPAPTDQVNVESENCLVVYYFHGDKRCVTCMKLEGYANEALNTYFAAQLASGDVVWKPVNTDSAQNSHFVTDYQLVSKSIVLSKIKDGKEVKWKNLDEIWDRVGDKEDYLGYIKKNVTEILGDQS